MHKLINRESRSKLLQYLDIFPTVVILGPQQCGKSTLAKMVAKDLSSFLYLDLQNRDDLAKMNEPSLLVSANQEKTICIDEIQLMLNLFSIPLTVDN
ncbi:MAG TPA: AAA family ATPase [Bacteroidales bacterium]|mgnify:CR=1 FL=1|nr:AAA family ATPase [Bacteroidales bacterium]